MTGRLDGRSAMVTGAGSGIGAATAEVLAARGARVALLGIVADDLERVAEGIRRGGGEALVLVGDVADWGFMQEAAGRCAAAFGGLDLAANCAAIAGESSGELAAIPHATFERVISVNLGGIFNSMKAQIPLMLARGRGAVVNIGSVNGMQTGLSLHSPYSASKYGLVGLSRSAALDYAARGVRINVVAPGVTDTPMARAGGEETDRMAATIPMRRLAEPAEIARVTAFLLCDDASYMTGSVVVVDGGYLLN